MKLRIRGDSLRLRLSQAEIARLRDTGEVGDRIRFADRSLEYVLVSADVGAPSARFDGDRIEVAVPHAVARSWAESEQVGIEAEQALSGGAALRLLIEKDFKCLAPRPGEDDSDAFPNPDAGSGSC
jgi:hypothetical protein